MLPVNIQTPKPKKDSHFFVNPPGTFVAISPTMASRLALGTTVRLQGVWKDLHKKAVCRSEKGWPAKEMWAKGHIWHTLAHANRILELGSLPETSRPSGEQIPVEKRAKLMSRA